MKSKKIYFALAALMAVALVADYFMGTTLSVVAAMAMTGVPTSSTVTTADSDSYSPEMLPEDICDNVIQMLPSRTPIDTIMRNVGRKQRATSQKVGYYQASYKAMNDGLNSSATGAGTSVSVPASSNTASTTNQLLSIYVSVQTPDIWRQSDTLLMRDLSLTGTKGSGVVGSTSTYTDDVMFYVEEKSSNILKLVPIGGIKGTSSNADSYIVPTFTSSTEIIRMGQAKSELSITTDPFAIYPALSHQYCQNFMAQIEESTFNRLSRKEANWGFSNYEQVNIMSMKMEMELSMLFGQEGQITSGNDRTYFTRGITRDIENVLTYGTSTSGDRTITADQYNNWLKEVFDGNNGSTNRVLFAGSGLVKSLSLVEDFTKNMSSVEKDASLGVDVRKVQSYFGTLDIVLSPLFKEAGWEDYGLILDIEHVVKHEFVPLSVTDLDLKSSGQRNANAKVLQEVSALTLRHPDCHAIIKPATA